MDYAKEISWISDPDYIPEPISYYDAWPEPHRSWALQALDYRFTNFDQIAKDKLKSFE